MTTILDVQNLYKIFELHILGGKQIRALEGISFKLEEGEAIGLTGSSGSGKSTLMKCIYRTYATTSGNIIYNSKQYGNTNLSVANEHIILRLRREEMTYCSQFLSVIPRVSALEIVAQALVVKNGHTLSDAVKTTKTYFEQLNLPEELWDGFPATFSGGEQQRINIARAIIAKPRFLLVDEPTASLDPKTKDAVIEMIQQLKDEGTAILCITHDRYTLERLSDKIFFLENKDFVDDIQVALPA